MKAYYYTAEECGLSEFSPGTMRLAGFDITENPEEADVFVVPTIMYWVGKENILKLPYLKGNERRHAMFNVADYFKTAIGIPAMMFRCDCTRWILEQVDSGARSDHDCMAVACRGPWRMGR